MVNTSDLDQVNIDHKVLKFPKIRKGVEDLLWAGAQKHVVHGVTEIDVSKPREIFKNYRANTSNSLSFTAYILKCLGQAVDENKYMHAYRKGKDKVIVFDEVDVSTIIERELAEMEGKKIPTTFVLRGANKKSFMAINDEIRGAQKEDLTKGPKAERMNLYLKLPKFIRRAYWRKLDRDPIMRKRMGGTVGLTAIGMFTGGNIGWAIPITPTTLTVTLGGIYPKPMAIDNKVEVRDVLCMTVSIDHDIIDGGPATRFIMRFMELIKEGFGLEELKLK
jgi:pyruvate/2-oxoglutarate dehydrogenase complex dihydrolipoamide acyltransferase (E2) component